MSKLSRKAIPSLRRHKASNRAYVVLSGKTIYLGGWGTKAARAKYERYLGEWLASGRNLSVDSDESSLTIAELLSRFVDYAEIHYRRDGKPTPTAERFKPILKLLRRLYGETLVTDFGALPLRAIQKRLIDSDLSRQTVNDEINRIKAIFRYGVSVDIVPTTVLESLRSVPSLAKGRSEARETDPILPVSDEDIERTLGHLPPIVAAMVQIQRLTGARPNEIVQMRPADIDRSGEIWIYTPEHHKTEHRGKQRIIPIGPKAQAIVTPYLDRHESDYCFDPREGEALRLIDLHRERKTPLSYGNRPGTNRTKKPKVKPGKCYSTASYRRAIHRACKKADIKRWSPNQLRHAMGTEARKLFGIESTRALLGHSSAVTTEIYAEADLQAATQIAKEIG
jgi:integrase